MSLDTLINEHYSQLNENDLSILRYITNNQVETSNLNITELASIVNYSTASILRLTKKLGFSGYSEFKYFLKQQIDLQTEVKNKDRVDYSTDVLKFDIDQTIKEFQNNKNLNSLFQQMDQVNTIYAFCVGYGQRLILKEFARCMLEFKKNVVIISGYNEFEKLSNDFTEDDLVLIVSQIGEVDELNTTLNNLRVRGCKTVSVTNLSNNDLAKHTMWNFYYENTNIDQETQMNRSSFLTLHLLLHLLFDSFVLYKKERP